MMEVVSGDNWSYKTTCKASLKSSPTTNNTQLYRGRCHSSSNQQCQSTGGKTPQKCY